MTPLQSLIDHTKRFLAGRAGSYRRTFAKENGDAQRVLKDLASFCRAHDTVFRGTERETGVLIGRQEVWLRIMQHMKLTDDELWALYGPRQPMKGE